ncbi:DUF805 domain-containing protein [Solimicrobium silvestre]|uniref:Putative membrane protein n=1 Tax=Solimicrobium silvestre TaxID=2099400 RepID=A0A2S9GTZ8_9BURK|nr:DUF805 domain-containing protein [Solimicrobium silvestre]PRC91202.1 putative membrane protein [Solimicrobium silvestre]
MTFAESIRICFNKYADFNGRASRSEFWWFALFTFLVSAALNIINRSGTLSGLFSLATLIPSLAVGARRLHDTNRSGWLQLLWFIPIIGWIFLLIWDVQDSDKEANRFDTAA